MNIIHSLTPPPRRGFLEKSLALVLGAISLAVPAAAGIAAFLNPWRQKTEAGQTLRVASLASLPLGGSPQSFPVIADRNDAWSHFPTEPIGAVFLQRIGESTVVAFQSICPHAGCGVSFDAAAKQFHCPCHGAKFEADGRRSGNPSVSLRDLDALDVEIRNEDEVWVRFRKFKTGTPDKIVRT